MEPKLMMVWYEHSSLLPLKIETLVGLKQAGFPSEGYMVAG